MTALEQQVFERIKKSEYASEITVEDVGHILDAVEGMIDREIKQRFIYNTQVREQEV